MKNQKVILGMSGGVDSSVAAHLLKKQNFEVIGMFMNSKNKNLPTSISWKEEEKLVKTICKKLGIKLIIKECGKSYEEKIIKKMFEDYKIGLTPNPDILCNNIGKFPLLYKIMKEENADFIATGHYARIKKDKTGTHLLRGIDETKDQSYFLVGIDKKYLEKTIFPIGNLTKQEVRILAKKLEFPNWDKKGSRGICYLGKINMKKFMNSRIQKKPGKIFDISGDEIGTHEGSHLFTIGESITKSKGISLNKTGRKKYSSDKLYVCEKQKNKIIVAKKSDYSGTNQIKIHKLKLLEKFPKTKFKARIRHLGEFYSGKLIQKKNKYIFKFNKKIKSLAPGQFIVFYKNEKVLGGGEIRLI
jgi:tRNA-specific 2-thiouridylase